MIIRSCCIHFL